MKTSKLGLWLVLAGIEAWWRQDWSSALYDLLSGVIAAAAVGAVDLVEYAVFNPAVFYVHNFPDVVPDLPQGHIAAFWSGWRASWDIYVPVRILLGWLDIHVRGVAHLCFPALCLLLMLYDRNTTQYIKKDIFYYHKWFYTLGAAVEVSWMLRRLAGRLLQ